MSIFAAGVLLALAGAAPPARAAGPDFCRDYARAAIRQVRGALNHGRCQRAVEDNPARWSSDFRVHYDWCLGVRRDEADRERDIRRDVLDRCARW